MSIEISREIEKRLAEEAQRQGVSVETLLVSFIEEHTAMKRPAQATKTELPIWHLGGVGEIHRRNIYDDVD